MFDANRSRVPVLAIAAQIPREEIGTGDFQETHPQQLFGECSVYCELVSVPEQLPRVLEIAMRAALQRGGSRWSWCPVRCSSRMRRRAAGLFGVRVEKADDLQDALQAAFAYDGPALVDVRTARQELSLPPKLAYGQIKGFTLYATRTVLSGAGDELIELARTNLRQLEID